MIEIPRITAPTPRLQYNMLEVDFYEIPEEFKSLPQWVNWKFEPREQGGKPTKILYSPLTGKRAKSTDPDTWATFKEARVAYERGGYSGVGYVFSDDDRMVGIDLDKCRDSLTGRVEPWAAEILTMFDETYCEISPSGTGFKIWAFGAIPGPRRRTGKIELYENGR